MPERFRHSPSAIAAIAAVIVAAGFGLIGTVGRPETGHPHNIWFRLGAAAAIAGFVLGLIAMGVYLAHWWYATRSTESEAPEAPEARQGGKLVREVVVTRHYAPSEAQARSIERPTSRQLVAELIRRAWRFVTRRTSAEND